MNTIKMSVVWIIFGFVMCIVLLRTSYGVQVRPWLLSELNPQNNQTSVEPTPAKPQDATPMPQSTLTATTVPPTATNTPQPTMTSTPTTYVVKVEAVEQSVRSASRLITYESVMDVIVTYSDEDKLPVWDNGQLFVMEGVYTVGASFDLALMNVTVNDANKISVVLPAPRLEAPAIDAKKTRYRFYKGGLKYLFRESDQAAYTAHAQIDGQEKAQKRACEIKWLDKAAEEAQYVIKDLVLNIDPRINSRDVTVSIPVASCSN
ncbi:MAG: DUF4230 domain-containing protein [Chloroflexales bacterium]|nr:DUF4230 domain-containing protein [Chloroflexales bacterium]